MDQSLDRLLTALDVTPHAFSVCRIQSGWRMTFPVFMVITIHLVLRGTGFLKVGDGEPLPFSPSSVLVVPALRSHWVGDARCTAGGGAEDTLLLCAAVSAPHDAALGLFDLLRRPVVDDLAASHIPPAIFNMMRSEVAHAGLGTQAMCQALMKQGLVTLLRGHWRSIADDALLAAALTIPGWRKRSPPSSNSRARTTPSIALRPSQA